MMAADSRHGRVARMKPYYSEAVWDDLVEALTLPIEEIDALPIENLKAEGHWDEVKVNILTGLNSRST